MRRLTASRALVVLLPILGALAPVIACGTTELVAAGGECSLATDCAPGLICAPVKGSRVCTADLATVAGKPPPEAGADTGDTGAGESDAIAQPDGAKAPFDSGITNDSGVDTGLADAATDG